MSLYSTRNLALESIEFPATNPCLIAGEWHWLVDATFTAWSLRAVTRARAANDLAPETAAAFDRIIAHVCDAYRSGLTTIEARAAAVVNLAPIPAAFFSPAFLAASGFTASPPWPTFDRDRAKFAPTVEQWPATAPEPAAKMAPPPDVVHTRRPAAPPRRYRAAAKPKAAKPPAPAVPRLFA